MRNRCRGKRHVLDKLQKKRLSNGLLEHIVKKSLLEDSCMDDLLAVAWEAFLARIAKKRNVHQYQDQENNSLLLRKQRHTCG